MAALVLCPLVAVLCIVTTESAAAPAPGNCSQDVGLTDVGVDCQVDPTDTNPILPTTDDGHTYTLVPVCSIGGAALCRDFQTCTDADGNQGFYYRVHRDGAPTPTTRCLTDARAREQRVITPGLVVSAFQRLHWPAGDLNIEPPGGRTLVNFDTNFYTTNTRPHTRQVTLLGRRITIEATPSRYTWRYGDGHSATTRRAGAPYPRLQITHRYLRADRYRPVLATTYTGRFRVGGGAWQQIPATVTIQGDATTLRAVEARPLLVGHDG